MINPASERQICVVYRKRLDPKAIMAFIILIFAIIISFNIYSSYRGMKENFEESVKKLNGEIVELKNDIKQSDVFTESLLKRLVEKGSIRAKITMYHPPSGGINSDSDPSMTATMTRPMPGKTCAISSKMVEEGWLGKEIYIDGIGIFIANDRLAKNITGYQIDICASSIKKAHRFGVRKNVLATMIDRKRIREITGG